MKAAACGKNVISHYTPTHISRNGNILYLYAVMRIIAVSTLKEYWIKHPDCEQQLKSWVQEMKRAEWRNSADLKQQYRHASIINSKRVVFNIKGNSYRLVVDIEYRLEIVFVVWLGTHKQYDKLDIENISYD